MSNTGFTTVNGNLTVTNGVVNITQNTQSLSGFTFAQYHATPDSSDFNFVRYRGTSASPAAIQSGDDIIDLAFTAYDGAAVQRTGGISSTVESAVGSGSIPSKMDFFIGSGVGANNGYAVAMSIGSDKVVDFKAAPLVAGVGSGQVNTGSVATYMKVKIGGVAYAIPAYAINP
jgi:type V secretory pathway adhesin AidA